MNTPFTSFTHFYVTYNGSSSGVCVLDRKLEVIDTLATGVAYNEITKGPDDRFYTIEKNHFYQYDEQGKLLNDHEYPDTGITYKSIDYKKGIIAAVYNGSEIGVTIRNEAFTQQRAITIKDFTPEHVAITDDHDFYVTEHNKIHAYDVKGKKKSTFTHKAQGLHYTSISIQGNLLATSYKNEQHFGITLQNTDFETNKDKPICDIQIDDEPTAVAIINKDKLVVSCKNKLIIINSKGDVLFEAPAKAGQEFQGVSVQSNGRSSDKKESDANAVKAMAQAAVNLELFTIPLYMTAMYSLTGMHQITSKNDLYRGRWWPGLSPSAKPEDLPYTGDADRLPKKTSIWKLEESGDPSNMLFSKTNNKIFNKIFKVFVEEMLHLQMASNLSRVLGVTKTNFTHPDLVTNPPVDNNDSDSTPDADTKYYAWHCYGDAKTTIPYIVDLEDTNEYADVKVKLGPLNHNQIRLFQAIEQPHNAAKNSIKPDKLDKYFPSVPFSNWSKESSDTKDLPLFGSIGHLYKCLWEYLHIQYDDNTMLMDHILESGNGSPQHDLFNEQNQAHPEPEYPGFKPIVFGSESDMVLPKIQHIINAITDQGEGGRVAEDLVMAVLPENQALYDALKENYKSFDDRGCPMASSHAQARAGKANVEMDHEEIFTTIESMMKEKDFLTWDKWHANGNQWTADMLHSEDYDNNPYSKKNRTNKPEHALPDPKEVADAMNRLKTNAQAEGNNPGTFDTMSQAATGAIKGIITVLNDYWSADDKGKTQFPFPSMGGSGDRMSICWAIYGRAPELEKGIKNRPSGKTHLNHACQGLAITPITDKSESSQPQAEANCADVSIYHTCKGSNDCRAEGGCGFVQKIGGSSNCSSKSSVTGTMGVGNGCKSPSANPPADNGCGGQGGCAVPISASQLYPEIPEELAINSYAGTYGQFDLYDFYEVEDKDKDKQGKSIHAKKIQKMSPYNKGDNVYQTAWEIVNKVYANRNDKNTPEREKPKASDFRLAFPPST